MAPKKDIMNKGYQWDPITFEYLLDRYDLANYRVMGAFIVWIVAIAAALSTTMGLLPQNWIALASEGTNIINFFLFNPALILGMLLFFWFGFEWGFTPVFLSSFILAFHSGMPWYWALIFGIAFVLGLAICAMAYQAFRISYGLRSFKSIVFYISIMFIGSIASSLGAFIWSFTQNLSAYKTLIIWKSWWSGSFLQALLVIAPILLLATPVVERYKRLWFGNPGFKDVSMKWVFGAVSSITGALALFIFSGKYLGKLRVKEVMRTQEAATVVDVISALESFEIISWISIGIIIVTGFGAFVLIRGWNKKLSEEVDNRTLELKESQEKLEESLGEKKILLREIHHRVKNNMALMGALLELQQRTGGEDSSEETLQTARSRIRSMAMAHEALYQNDTFSDISLKNYIKRVATYTHNSFKNTGVDIDLEFDLEDTRLEMTKSIPLGLLVNEVLINAFKHAFKGREEGLIELKSEVEDDEITIQIRDNGIGLPANGTQPRSGSLGMTLIKKFSKQLHGDLSVESEENQGTGYILRFGI